MAISTDISSNRYNWSGAKQKQQANFESIQLEYNGLMTKP